MKQNVVKEYYLCRFIGLNQKNMRNMDIYNLFDKQKRHGDVLFRCRVLVYFCNCMAALSFTLLYEEEEKEK